MIEITKGSTAELVLRQLAVVWAPAVEAARLQSELNVRSLEETSTALRRAGYEVYQADLPAAVSGVAAVVDGGRYIVMNRCKSPEDQQYTASHELA